MIRKATFLRLLTLVVLLPFAAFAPVKAEPVYAGSTVVYNLYATDGFVTLADGEQLYIYGFVGGRQGQDLKFLGSDGTVKTVVGGPPAPTGGPIQPAEQQFQGNAQFPAPLIYAKVGDIVEIRLKNLGVALGTAPNDPHSIHLHGLDVDAANDGVPETSVAAVPANSGVPGAGNVVIYTFQPKFPGTYMYHCHQEADIHVQMGMYGALVIYNPYDAAGVTGPGTGKGGNLWGWSYAKDYVMLLSEVDTRQHESEQFSADPAFNPVDYKPQYWFINGLSFPNTIHVNTPGFSWTNWLATHPNYDPLIAGSVGARDRVLIRVINMGFETQPMHMHGFHGKILGSDQRAWTFANSPGTIFGLGMEKQTLLIGSGETFEWLVNFGEQKVTSTYPAGTQTRFDPNTGLPVSNTQTGNPIIKWGDDAYIGGPTVSGAVGLPGPSQLFPFHNHDDYKATNNGSYPGGMFTMLVPTP